MKFPKLKLLNNIINIKQQALLVVLSIFLSLLTFELVLNQTTLSYSTVTNKLIATDNVNPPVIQLQINESATLEVNSRDYRALVLDEYFLKYKSPLFGHADLMVEMCDKYDYPSDCTLLAAIAYGETKLCTQNITAQQFNCWGWGGSGENRIIFKDFEDAIINISKRMSDGYHSILTSPELIARTYCGPQCGTWARAVIDQQIAINSLARNMGLEKMGN